MMYSFLTLKNHKSCFLYSVFSFQISFYWLFFYYFFYNKINLKVCTTLFNNWSFTILTTVISSSRRFCAIKYQLHHFRKMYLWNITWKSSFNKILTLECFKFENFEAWKRMRKKSNDKIWNQKIGKWWNLCL